MKIFRPTEPAVQGFTLIELSIVLVVIGLLAGGILTGRELINAARIRSQISQLNAYNLAVNTFMGKYNGLPGDIDADRAESVGMEYRSGADGHGDDDGNFEACTWTGTEYSDAFFNCETALFWRDLSYAKLIPHEFNAAIDDINVIDSTNIDLYLPRSKLNAAAQIGVYSPYHQDPTTYKTCPGLYCFSIASIISTDNNGRYFLNSALSAAQAYQIDSKMDDGLPDTGMVVGGRTIFSSGGFNLAAHRPFAARCQDADAPNTYNVNEGNLNNLNSMRCVINVGYK